MKHFKYAGPNQNLRGYRVRVDDESQTQVPDGMLLVQFDDAPGEHYNLVTGWNLMAADEFVPNDEVHEVKTAGQ